MASSHARQDVTSQNSRTHVLLPAIAVAGGLAFALSILDIASQSPLPRTFLVLAVLTIAVGFANFRMPNGTFSFSVSDSFTMTAALLFGPAAATTLVAFDSCAMSARLSRQQRTVSRVLYNATAPALSMWLSAQVFVVLSSALGRSVPESPGTLLVPLLVFASVYFVLNTGFVAIPVARELREPLVRVWRTHFAKFWFSYFLGASVAGLARLLSDSGEPTVTPILLLVPFVAVLYVTAHGVVERLRERRQHMAELDLFATALRSTADAVMLTDPDRRVTFMNTAAERLTGCTIADGRGRSDYDVFQVRDPTTREPNHPGALEPGVMAELLLTRADGSQVPIEEMHAPLHDEHGEFRGFVWTFRDIRDRKAIEAQRELLLTMEQEARVAAVTANRMKDEFLLTVSHELRTPATSILGWARVLTGGHLDADASRRALGALERSARAQATVLEDLIDSSQIAQGTLRLDVRRTDVMIPLREALETLEPAFQAKNVRVTVAAPSALPAIDADPDRLRQVFWNILGNAIKFTPEAGCVTVCARRDDDVLVIEISDNGQGIDPDFLSFVFDRFRQGDASTTRVHRGLGLGLAIVRYLVESHGGTVHASSEGVGHGARFTVRLPAAMGLRESDRRLPALTLTG